MFPSRALTNLNPLPFFILQLLIQIYIYGFTSSTSPLRILILPLIILCAVINLFNSTLAFPTAGPNTLFVVWSFLHPLLYIENALRSRWDFEHQGPTRSTQYSQFPESGVINGRVIKKRNGTFRDRIQFGIKTAWSLRDVNSPWHVKGVPGPVSKTQKSDRREFLKRSAIMFALSYLYLDIIENAPLPDDLSRFKPDKYPIFGRSSQVSLEEVVMRIIVSASIWSTTYACITVATSAQALVLVALKINEPGDWPFYFGSIKSAYTIRGFWGDFWHSILRKPFTGNAHTMAHTILHLPANSLIARYTRLFLVFAQSGLYHLVLDLVIDIEVQKSEALKFFCIQAFGIMLEDGVQAMFRRLTGRKRGDESEKWMKVVGFAWVVLFLLAWTSPSWHFVIIAHRVEQVGIDRRLLPLSMVERWMK